MNAQKLTEVWNKMEEEVKSITEQMNTIFAKHPDCEAPEFMKGQDLEDWSYLWRIRRAIFDRQTAIESAVNEFVHFYEMEIA